MLLEKLVPINSDNHKEFQTLFEVIGQRLDSQGWIQLFTLWTLTVSGIVLTMDLGDRYIYWEWGGWSTGLAKLGITTIFFNFVLRPRRMWSLGDKVLSNKELASHVFIGLGLIGFGWFDPTAFLDIKSSAPYDAPLSQSYVDTLYSLLGILPYATSFTSCALIFQFKLKLNLENRVWSVVSWEQKLKFLSLSIFLMSITIILGISLDDPVVSTAGAVSIPFAIIALIWPSHVRHLQRARFYPLFIFAMFLCVRAPWFLIPLAILFFSIRTVNYLRYGIVHPSFGVDFLDEHKQV